MYPLYFLLECLGHQPMLFYSRKSLEGLTGDSYGKKSTTSTCCKLVGARNGPKHAANQRRLGFAVVTERISRSIYGELSVPWSQDRW